jgi:hypothetical protein
MSATVGDAVRSALVQPEVDDVIIVVDGSDAPTDLILATWSTDARIRVVHHDVPRGPSRARNEGLALARNEWLVFLDGDDALEPGALSALLAARTSDAVAVCGRFQPIDGQGQPLDIGTWQVDQLRPVVRRRGRVVPSPNGIDDEALLSRLVVPPPSGILVKRDAARAIGGFDASYSRSEDIGFLIDLTTMGALVPCDATVVRYRRTAGQRSQAGRRRQRGRQAALVRMIRRATTPRSAWRRARGAAAHHFDRASRRWTYSERTLRDLIAILRSLLLGDVFLIVGASVAVSRFVRISAPRHAVDKLGATS